MNGIVHLFGSWPSGCSGLAFMQLRAKLSIMFFNIFASASNALAVASYSLSPISNSAFFTSSAET